MTHLEIIIKDEVVFNGPEGRLKANTNIAGQLVQALIECHVIEIVRTYQDGDRHIVIIEGQAITRRMVKQKIYKNETDL